ncbi:MAG: hypothetical protein MJ133_04845 [Lachnospiraceae bacterium]|nr:hypothetical protein [Lachnospiraceae bacterium]
MSDNFGGVSMDEIMKAAGGIENTERSSANQPGNAPIPDNYQQPYPGRIPAPNFYQQPYPRNAPVPNNYQQPYPGSAPVPNNYQQPYPGSAPVPNNYQQPYPESAPVPNNYQQPYPGNASLPNNYQSPYSGYIPAQQPYPAYYSNPYGNLSGRTVTGWAMALAYVVLWIYVAWALIDIILTIVTLASSEGRIITRYIHSFTVVSVIGLIIEATVIPLSIFSALGIMKHKSIVRLLVPLVNLVWGGLAFMFFIYILVAFSGTSMSYGGIVAYYCVLWNINFGLCVFNRLYFNKNRHLYVN